MSRSESNRRPGSSFAFKPRDTLASVREPQRGPGAESARLAEQFESMVNERAPPKVPPGPAKDAVKDAVKDSAKDAVRPRADSADDDFDITAVIKDWASPGNGLPGDGAESAGAPGATSHPTFGHPTKMMSSLKQKANIFIHQKTRPEHHLGTRVYGPRPPTYHDRRPQAMPMFESKGPSAARSRLAAPRLGDEVFYTDPSKASADLKALLEGGMDEDEGEDGDEDETPLETKSENVGTAKQGEDEAAAAAENKTKSKKKKKKEGHIDESGAVDGLGVRLLPHQVEGVNWMRGRELGPVKRGSLPKGGLLADDMGLGKTLQTISLILTNPKPAKDDEGWKKSLEGVAKTTLVVAPLALIRQWENEMQDKVEKARGLKVLVHHGPQRNKKARDMALYDVVITTYQILVSEHAASSSTADGPKTGCFGTDWWRVVLDEAHTIKNRLAKTTKACYGLRAQFRWCLSGTPMQNNLDELQSLICFLRIKPYDDMRQWKEHITMPLKNGKGHIAIRRLHSVLRCFMKRRTKEILKERGALHPGGAEAAADGEAPATEFRHTERNVVTVSAQLSPAERTFYDRLHERADRSMEAMMRNKMSYINAFTLLLRLRQACNHPNLVRGKLDRDKDALAAGASQKKQDADVDDVADMFAGMGLASKSCGICGRGLDSVDVELGRENCLKCHEDLEYFNRRQSLELDGGKKRKNKKQGRRRRRGDEGVKQTSSRPGTAKGENEIKPKAEDDDDEEKQGDVPGAGGRQDRQAARRRQRQRRNRNAVIDSDDEDDDEDDAEGRWLVPESERGELHLGKAGGEEDENAEGGGDWIGSEDSADDGEDDEDDKDQSNLSSFVVDDETAGASDDDGDSLMSVAALTQKMAAQTLDDGARLGAAAPEADDPGSGSGSGSELESGAEAETETDDDDDDDDDDDNDGKPAVLASAKMVELARLLHAEAAAHKFIVFSEFTSMLDLVEPLLRRERFGFRRYDGGMRNEEREESLRRLRTDARVRVLLCSLRCGSLGLNLTAATRVVIMEPFWNPFVEEQAIDRVHRLNQTVDVTVYRLTVADTVEERIIELQNKKRLLAAHAIEGVAARKDALRLGLADLVDLFRPAGGAGAHASPGDGDDDGAAAAELARARQAAGLLRRAGGGAPARTPREESAVYGRRW